MKEEYDILKSQYELYKEKSESKFHQTKTNYDK
jgi:hypothetical protein